MSTYRRKLMMATQQISSTANTFGGLMLCSLPLRYSGGTYMIYTSDTWTSNTFEDNNITQNTRIDNSTYHGWRDIGAYFDSSGSNFSSSKIEIDNNGNRISYNGYNDWRVPKPVDFFKMLPTISTTGFENEFTGSTRPGSTISGTNNTILFVKVLVSGHPYGEYGFDGNDLVGNAIILFPDNKTISTSTITNLVSANSSTAFFSANTLTQVQLQEYINAGCSILPMIGFLDIPGGWYEWCGSIYHYEIFTSQRTSNGLYSLNINNSNISISVSENGPLRPVYLVRDA